MPEKAGCGGDDCLRLAFREGERFGFSYAWEPATPPRGDAFRTTRAALPPQPLQRLDEQCAARALSPILSTKASKYFWASPLVTLASSASLSMSSPLFMVAPFSGRLLLLCGRVGFAYPPFIREPKPFATIAL